MTAPDFSCGLTPEFQTKIALVQTKWNLAEETIKQAEGVCDEVVFPSITELRYAGRRLVEALNVCASDPKQAERLIEDACFFCCRAQHDSIDAATSKVVGDIAQAVKTYGPLSVTQGYPNLPKLRAVLNEARKLIEESRKDRDNRDAIYEVIRASSLADIISLYNEFNGSLADIEAISRSHRHQGKREKIYVLAGLFVGISGILLGRFWK